MVRHLKRPKQLERGQEEVKCSSSVLMAEGWVHIVATTVATVSKVTLIKILPVLLQGLK